MASPMKNIVHAGSENAESGNVTEGIRVESKHDMLQLNVVLADRKRAERLTHFVRIMSANALDEVIHHLGHHAVNRFSREREWAY